MKSGYVQIDNECVGSHPTRGAWIEIPIIYDSNATSVLSHPTRGAWIEMLILALKGVKLEVAPHPGCVD